MNSIIDPLPTARALWAFYMKIVAPAALYPNIDAFVLWESNPYNDGRGRVPIGDVTFGDVPVKFSDPKALTQVLRFTLNYANYLKGERYKIFYEFFMCMKQDPQKLPEEYCDLEQRVAFDEFAEAGEDQIRARYNDSKSAEFRSANPAVMMQLYNGVIAPYAQLHPTAADTHGDFKRTKTGALITAVVDKHV